MRVLLPADLPSPDTDDALYAAYAAPRRDWVRANFVASADGSATLNGVAGPLGNPTDQRVLAILRAHADVVVVGAGTVQAEDYGPLKHTAARIALRRAGGLAEHARLAVVCRNAHFTGAERWIAQAPVPPLLLTSYQGARTVPGAETIGCGEDWVDIERALDALAERGLTAVLTEGGPHLFGDFARSARLDELCLTVSPILVGPGSTRIVAGPVWEASRPGQLTQVIEDDGLLFLRYWYGPGAVTG
ncbi:MAG TPA: dihydrofolate reductase family protein [Mycobacteriales bacterium]|nr:dihydrofolate reductase family protein [Mycobacteriales bacterium]